MTAFETALQEVITASPFITAAFAAIGLATVAWLVWSALKPIVGYIVSGPRQMMSFWLYAMFIFGGGAWGYSLQDVKGMWCGLGVTATTASCSTILLYWIRQWVAWYHSEKPA